MNQMQQMIIQAQKMQRELAKAHAALDEKEFKVEKNGMVTVVAMGSKKIKEITIDPEAVDPENVEMLQDTIAMAINEVMETIEAENAAIDEKITGQKGNHLF